MLNIGVCGYSGKVGTSLISKLLSQPDLYRIAGKHSSKEDEQNFENMFRECEVVADFSNIALLENLLHYAALFRVPLVVGTTGLRDIHFQLLNKAAADIAIVYSANMTIGANLIKLLASKISDILDDTYDIEILEAHQRSKKDAPSGTALEIAKAIYGGKGLAFNAENIYDRANQWERGKIGFASIRGGRMLAEHSVIFAGDDEIIEIKHRALNKECYNDGIIKALNWIIGRKPGLYSMLDVLAINL